MPLTIALSTVARLQVLRFEASRSPELLGASVFGYNDAYCKLHPFLRKWRAAAEAEAAGGGALLQPFLGSVGPEPCVCFLPKHGACTTARPALLKYLSLGRAA